MDLECLVFSVYSQYLCRKILVDVGVPLRSLSMLLAFPFFFFLRVYIDACSL